MSAQFYVHRARAQVAEVRARVGLLGYDVAVDERLDVEALAVAFLTCEVVALQHLSERVAFAYLERTYGVDTSGETPSGTPLAGGLFVSRTGSHRWVFVDASESPARQRFTIAHELGHLVLEAEPALARTAAQPPSLFDDEAQETTHVAPLLTYGRRCTPTVVGPDTSQSGGAPSRRPRDTRRLSPDELREIQANHFAAELLMPYEGVRRVIAGALGPAGVQGEADLDHVVSVVASRYDVSFAAARLRLTKDFGVTGETAGGLDLFT